jgi:hypothetical protein
MNRGYPAACGGRSSFLNSIAAIILADYKLFNMILVDLVIIVGSGFLLFLNQAKTSVAYKIGLSWFLCLTLLIKILLSLQSKATFENNTIIIWLLSITLVEIILISIVTMMSRHASISKN